MRNTQESGQILRSKKRPRPTGRSGRGSRTNSNTSRQIPARVIDAAYDARPATDFCAETPAQPSIGPLTPDLNLPADFFPPSLIYLLSTGAALNFRPFASGFMSSNPLPTCSIPAVPAAIFPEPSPVRCQAQ